MHVIATAGHVDHGKSSLVKALTGMDPDRLAAEQERGLSIELGHCSTHIEPVGDVAFVDVPGHERFISTMLAGVGSVPAVLFVVAADDPWMPQAAEHLAALDALGVTRGVLAITRCDLAVPDRARDQARAALRGTTLESMPSIAVSAHTGVGLDELRAGLVTMLSAIPRPSPEADVRLWVDRRFTIHGTGTIITGTIPAGRISVGEVLDSGEGSVRVRGMQALGRSVEHIEGPARVALSLGGDGVASIERGSVLVSPQAWHFTSLLDVRIRPSAGAVADSVVPKQPMMHVGAAAWSTRFRRLSADLGRIALDRSLPLRIGDRALLRDPGSRQMWGITVVDPAPPPLHGRGAAARRVVALSTADGRAELRAEVARRGIVSMDLLRRIGVPESHADVQALITDGWVLDADRADALGRSAYDLVREHDRRFPLDPGVPITSIAKTLGLPSTDLVPLIRRDPMRLSHGRLMIDMRSELPASLQAALQELERDLESHPFAAPTVERLRELALDTKALAAAERHQRIIRVAPDVVLPAGADLVAVDLLRELPQPFTVSEARVKLATTRRVAVPLLEYLDRAGYTTRFTDDRRTVRS